MKTITKIMTALLMLIGIAGFGQINAGPDQLICLGTSATMAASGSGVSWAALPSNPGTVSISNPSSPTTSIDQFPMKGVYGFTWGSTILDTVLITVRNEDTTYVGYLGVLCPGALDTFVCGYNNSGLGQYTFDWYINNTSTGDIDTLFLASGLQGGDQVSCHVTNTQSCNQALAAYLPITIPTAPAAPVISQTGSCAGHDTLVLSGVSSANQINWYLNGTLVDTTLPPIRIVAGNNGYGSAANQLIFPNSMYVDAAGNIYIADQSNNRIQKFPAGSTSAINATTVAAAGIRLAEGVFVDASGNIYVTDDTYNRVLKFPAGSNATTTGVIVAGGNGAGSAANQFNYERGLWVDAAGNIYVCDQGNNRVQKFPAGSTSATNGVTVAGGNGQGSAANQLYAPNAVCFDAAGNMYVTDLYNNRIQKFPAGSTSATNGVTVAGGNGAGNAANQLNQPLSTYIDAAGYLYVADYYNSRVQKFAPGSTSASNGITVAGTGHPLGGVADVYADNAGDIFVLCNGGNGHVEEWTAPVMDSTYVPLAAGVYTVSDIVSTYVCPASVSAPVTVSLCPGDSMVWPGDANHDGIADNTDLLPIGIAYGLNGFARAATSIVWQADYCQDWGVQFLSGINAKHADCNGDDIIDANDTTAILQNFGLTHAKTDGYNTPWRSGIPGITLHFSQDTVAAGDTLTVGVLLGDSATSVSNIYGLAFTYHYDALVVDSTTTSFGFTNSFIGNSATKISIQKDFKTQGLVKAAVTGINHTNRSGYGQIATFIATITTGNINGKDLSYYSNVGYISDITAIDKDGNPVALNAGTDSNQVAFTPSGIHEVNYSSIQLYPNPAKDAFTISGTGDMVYTPYILTDVTGRAVLTGKLVGEHTQVSISSLSSGVYMLQLGDHKQSYKVIKD